MSTLLMADEWKCPAERRVWTRMHKLIVSALDIEKHYKSTTMLRKERSDDDNRGWMGKIAPDTFLVGVAQEPAIRMLACYAHECVHVKQYLHGEMEDMIGTGFTKWKGKVIPVVQNPNADRYQKRLYLEQPWEKEAFQKMNKITLSAFDTLPREDKEWILSDGGSPEDLREEDRLNNLLYGVNKMEVS